MKLLFGDIVVVDNDQIGVVVKSWARSSNGDEPKAEVYVRNYHGIKTYPISQVERYHIRHKELSDEEKEWQEIGSIEE